MVFERFWFNSILYPDFPQTLDKSPREASAPSDILHLDVVLAGAASLVTYSPHKSKMCELVGLKQILASVLHSLFLT